MKFLYNITLLLVTAVAFAQGGIGKTELKSISSAVFNAERSIIVYLPAEYEAEPERKFEVLYVFDAQNEKIFNMAVSIAEYLTENDLNPMIIVGVKTDNRWNEFLPQVKDPNTIAQIEGFFGKEFNYGNADVLANHLIKEVFPVIDGGYRTLPTKVALGHSFGGTFVTYCLVKYPELFDAHIVVSPNLVFDAQRMLEHITEFRNSESPLHSFSYIAYGRQGDYENQFYESTQKGIELLNEAGVAIVGKEFEDANHSSILPYGIAAGLTEYHETFFLNGNSVINYFTELEEKGALTLTAEQAAALSEKCYQNNRTDDAITILQWAIGKFPKTHSLYGSIGEYYAAKGDRTKAKEFYGKAVAALTAQKNTLGKKLYEEKLGFYNKKLQDNNKKQ